MIDNLIDVCMAIVTICGSVTAIVIAVFGITLVAEELKRLFKRK